MTYDRENSGKIMYLSPPDQTRIYQTATVIPRKTVNKNTLHEEQNEINCIKPQITVDRKSEEKGETSTWN